jgi:anti-anti-sigma factor
MCAAAAERPGASSVGNLLMIVPLDDRPGGLKLIGEVDISNRQQLADALEPYVHKEEQDLYLELEDLSFIDVGGVSVLVGVAEQLSPQRRLVLGHPPRVLRRILELAWPDPAPMSMVSA